MLTHIHPFHLWFTCRTSSLIKGTGAPSSESGPVPEPPSAQSPFARLGRYLRRRDVQHLVRGRYPSFIAPTSPCARPKPSHSLGVSPCATSPCRVMRPPAGRWPFPTLSPQSFYGCLDPYPAALIRCTRSFLPGRHRPHLSLNRFGAQEHPP